MGPLCRCIIYKLVSPVKSVVFVSHMKVRCLYWIALQFLLVLIGAFLTPENISGVLAETPPLINESDLHISQVP